MESAEGLSGEPVAVDEGTVAYGRGGGHVGDGESPGGDPVAEDEAGFGMGGRGSVESGGEVSACDRDGREAAAAWERKSGRQQSANGT